MNVSHGGNLDEYLLSTHAMLPEMLTYSDHDYNEWCPHYWAMITSLSFEKENYFSKHITQSMTGLQYSNQLMDLWIEVTMNLNSNLKQR